MRAIWLILVAACELVPAPKGQQQQAGGSAAAPAAPAVAPANPAQPQAAPQPGVAVEDACTQVGVRWAEAYIADAHDPQQKAMLEQERTEIVRRIQQGCRDQKWNDEVRSCMLAAKAIPELQACAKKLQPAQPAQAPAPAAAPQAAAKAAEPAAKKPADVKKPADAKAKKPADAKAKKPADAKKPG